jgi:uncharacterized protein YqjF (DUF2071 family)
MPKTFLNAHWENLIMANYAIKPELLFPYLPKGVEIDLFEDKCYVSLVGFMFKNTRLFHIPIPFFGTFEEVNLRFYVKRKEGNSIKRGVVFINETVPYKAVAWLANKLYKEHYIAVPTKNEIEISSQFKNVKYEWFIDNKWNHIAVNAENNCDFMLPGTVEQFIFEHYYGYTKINNQISQEYHLNHPSWKINKVLSYSIDCNFESMYGIDFAFLNHQEPDTILIAEGSDVSVEWNRTRF